MRHFCSYMGFNAEKTPKTLYFSEKTLAKRLEKWYNKTVMVHFYAL